MNDNSSGIGAGILIVFLLIYLVFLIAYVWAGVRIIQRSGYSGWWILVGIVPLLNVIMFFVFAFKEAPTERELKQLRAWAASQRGGYQQGGYQQGGYPPGGGYQPGGYQPGY